MTYRDVKTRHKGVLVDVSDGSGRRLSVQGEDSVEASFARSILFDAPMAVLAVDADGFIRSSNATADSFFGGPVATGAIALDRLVEDVRLRGGATRDAIAAFNVRSRSGGEGVHVTATRLDGTKVPVDIQAARFDAVGEEFLTLFIQDIAPVIAMETVVQELRAAITYNWRLNSLGEMASMLAHELNQPLSAVANNLHSARSLLTRDCSDLALVSAKIEAAEVQAQRAGDTIRRLRVLMSRDTGYHQTESILELVEEVLPLLQMSVREVEATISIDIGPDDALNCDRIQLQQVMSNLVRNAAEAPGTEQPRRVLIRGRRSNAGYVLTVEDNGPGIHGQIADRLFEPMASTKPQGMGLGLSICRTIIDAHGGSMVCRPSALGGAAFVMTFPMLRESPQ